MRVLVTRPKEDSRDLAEALTDRGHEVLLQPLLIIEPAPLAVPLDLSGIQALLFTSANGVRALAALTAHRDLPVFAVGDATARTARAAGFECVASAGGDVADLARLVAARLDPAAGPLFHGAASVVAGDLKGRLEAAGFSIERRVLYRAEPVASLAPEVETAWRASTIDAALFFSPRSVESFAELVRACDLVEAARHCHAMALSPAVADRLAELPWTSVRTAERPTTEALLKGLDLLASSSMMGGTGT
ncbi:MAG: uroporphyrinogen-III synthase [Pseudomonadota bacterium]